MKKIMMIAMVVLVAALLAVPSSFAYPVSAGQYIWVDRIDTVGGGDGGGEFSIHSASPSSENKLFETFCLEKNEYITIPGKYYIHTIQDAVVNGGEGGGSPDPLDSKTKYLFYKFSAGTLSGYGNTNESANALQEAIWYIENEITSLSAGLATTFYTDALNAGQGTWDVKAMNLVTFKTDGSIDHKQSLLVAQVPEPATLLLLGAGLLGMGMMVRRRKR